MKVVFLLRADAPGKPGGDSRKVVQYRQRLSELGWSAEVIFDRNELQGMSADIVHLINLDLPAENLRNAKLGRSLGAKIVLSSIRHPLAGIREMYELGQDSFYSKLRRLPIDCDHAVTLREGLKLAMRRDVAALSAHRGYVASQAALLGAVDMVLPMAESEGAGIVDDFGYQGMMALVPNALTLAERAELQPTCDLVALGRIEPRKNSLELARAADMTGVRLAMAGQLNLNHKRYVEEFLELAATSKYVTYVGEISHDEVPRFLASGAAYINPAWFEVVSQADFEAINLGIPVVSTVHSYIGDFVQDLVLVEPSALVANPKSLPDVIAGARICAPPTQRTWSDAGDDLDQAYRRLLGLPTPTPRGSDG